MRRLFSDEFKFKTWRKLWAALAQAQFELGLDGVTADRVKQIQNLQNVDIDYAFVEEKEKLLRHDVMSHVHEVAMHIPGKKKFIIRRFSKVFRCCKNCAFRSYELFCDG
jgi:adenylosuccinate lyase